MPTLSGIDGRSLGANLGQAVSNGFTIQGQRQDINIKNQQLAAQQDLAEKAKQRLAQKNAIIGQLNTPNDAHARKLLSTMFPEDAKKIADAEAANFGNQSAREKQRTESVVKFALELKDQDPEVQINKLKARKSQLLAQGLPTNDTDDHIKLLESGDIEAANALVDQAIGIGERLKIIEQAPEQFTDVLDGQGNVMAQKSTRTGKTIAQPNAVKTDAQMAQELAKARAGATNVTVGANGQPREVVTPQVLLEGLPEGVAAKVDATFKAVGGGKDGIDAISKTIKEFNEADRRTEAVNILSDSFPDATGPEMAQLKAAMSSSGTTEKGLNQARSIREEQVRKTKQKGFQQRSIALLKRILESPALERSVGPVQGRVDVSVTGDGANFVADVEEVGNIMTGDNLDLMTGVLSESDIKIIRNLSSGGLNRLRSVPKFKSDVAKMLSKMQSKTVRTVNDGISQGGKVRELSDEDLAKQLGL